MIVMDVGPPLIARIAGAMLAVENQDVMVAFFEKLGFAKTVDRSLWPGARWVEVALPGAETSIVLTPARAYHREPDRLYTLTLSCHDLLATAETLRAAGIEVDGPTHEPSGSYIQVVDPEGRVLFVNDVVGIADPAT